MKKLVLLLSAASITLAASEFRIFGSLDSRDPKTEFAAENHKIGSQVYSTAYFTVDAWPQGKPHYQLKFIPGKPGDGFSFEPNDANWLLMNCGSEKLTGVPDLYCAFRIFPAEGCGEHFELVAWSEKQKKSIKHNFTAAAGKWQTIRIPFCSSGFLEKGDSAQWLHIGNMGTAKRTWKIDSFAIWQGTAPRPAAAAQGTVTEAGDDLRLTWNAAVSALPVSYYRIHRGSVENFTVKDGNLIGESFSTDYVDSCPMRRDYFYKVVTVDIAGNSSEPALLSRK